MHAILTKVRENCELRNLAENTQLSYSRHIRQFFEFFPERKPEELGTEEIRKYLLHLKRDKKQASQTLNLAYSALKFFYYTVLERPWEISPVPRVKLEKKLPVVLSIDEITQLFDVIKNIKHKALLTVIYSAGLRTSEAASLRVSNIDSSRMQIRIDNSKGAKDRYTILSEKTLLILREYWRIYKPQHWLFPGQSGDKPISYKNISRIFNEYKKQAGITKPASVHIL